jgi:hypothetical protein
MKVLLRIIKGSLYRKWPLALAIKSLEKATNLETLEGKIKHKMAFDRNPLMTIAADKVAVRDYVIEKIGAEYLPDLLAIFETPEELIDFDFPPEFALKSNHGSGAMILVTEFAPKESRLPKKIFSPNWVQYFIKPEEFDKLKAVTLCRQWMSQNYYYRVGKHPEWAYKNIPPKILVEKLMLDSEGQLPKDYKFFVIGGEVEFIQVDSQRFDGHKRDLYNPDWNLIDGSNVYPRSGLLFDRPEELNKMLELARKLASGFDFIRVDLYLTAKGIKFGELTNYPGGGDEKFSPYSLSMNFARNWSPTKMGQ